MMKADELVKRFKKAQGMGWHPFALEVVQIAEDAIALAQSDAARIAELEALLRRVSNEARVGNGKTPVTRSKRVNIPATLFHEISATLKEASGGEG